MLVVQRVQATDNSQASGVINYTVWVLLIEHCALRGRAVYPSQFPLAPTAVVSTFTASTLAPSGTAYD